MTTKDRKQDSPQVAAFRRTVARPREVVIDDAQA